MQITDYESGRQLRDVDIVLTRDEAEDLLVYLGQLLRKPSVNCAFVSEIDKWTLKKEITVSVKKERAS